MTQAEELERIRIQFPTANYPPDPSCKRCQGTGSITPTKVIVVHADLSVTTEIRDTPHACACIFLHPVYRETIVEMIKEFAHNELTKMKESI